MQLMAKHSNKIKMFYMSKDKCFQKVKLFDIHLTSCTILKNILNMKLCQIKMYFIKNDQIN